MREEMMNAFHNLKTAKRAGVLAVFACALLAGTSAARAADTTYDRLVNPEPQNWLTVHHDYGAQRFSALGTINRANVKNLKLVFAVALGGTSNNESLEATPLVEDGFMYIVDSWGIVSKIDMRSGTSGPIVWQMNPKLEKQDRNRGVALWNNLVISVTGYEGRVIATDKETGNIVGQEPARPGGPGADGGAAGLERLDRDRRLGRRSRPAQLGRFARSQDRRYQVENLFDSGAGRARQRDLEEQQLVANRRRRLLCHWLLRSRHKPHLLGIRQSGARLRSELSARRQSLHVKRDRV
jgi:hypothetical protein